MAKQRGDRATLETPVWTTGMVGRAPPALAEVDEERFGQLPTFRRRGVNPSSNRRCSLDLTSGHSVWTME